MYTAGEKGVGAGRRAQRLRVIAPSALPGFMVPPAAGGHPAYRGHRDLDYVCGSCGQLLAEGVAPGAFANIAFQCPCGAANLVPPAPPR